MLAVVESLTLNLGVAGLSITGFTFLGQEHLPLLSTDSTQEDQSSGLDFFLQSPLVP